MIETLSDERQYLVTENQSLIYHIIYKLGITYSSQIFEDLVQIGNIGLIRAAIRFNFKCNFSTFAYVCIRNEILLYLKKTNKYNKSVIAQGSVCDYTDNIKDPEEDKNQKLINQDYLCYIINITINSLSGKERFVILCKLAGLLHKEIARYLKIVNTNIPYLRNNAIAKIQKVEKTGNFEKKFIFRISKNQFVLTFDKNLYHNLDEFLKNFSYNLNVSIVSDTVKIILSAKSNSFLILAFFFQELEEFQKSKYNK